jgi:hypothetical protein
MIGVLNAWSLKWEIGCQGRLLRKKRQASA